MTEIYIAGSLADKEFVCGFCGLLEQCLSAPLSDSAKSGIIIINTDKSVKIENSIVVINGKPKGRITFGKNARAVFMSSDKDAADALKGARCGVVACGMSLRDTISLSAKDDELASVSLQRSIVRLDGKKQEECEIQLKNKCFSDFQIMAAAASLLLLPGEYTI